MQLLQIASVTASLVGSLFPIPSYAQDFDFLNQNLTLRFFTSSQDESCESSDARHSITFTTNSVPVLQVCFDLADLLSMNETSGFVNQTGNRPAVAGEHGLYWSINKTEGYEASANYSTVLYQQHFPNPNFEDQKPGQPARTIATLYPGKGCTQKDPNDDKGLLPWYGFSCLTDDEGTCGTASYSFQSFYIQPSDSDSSDKCWDFARNGQSSAVRKSVPLVAAFVGAGVAVLLV